MFDTNQTLPPGYGDAPPPMSAGKIAFLPQSSDSYAGVYQGAQRGYGAFQSAALPRGQGMVYDFGDLAGRAERVSRKCARVERYYTKQRMKYEQSGKNRNKKKMDKYKAKLDACTQSGAYQPSGQSSAPLTDFDPAAMMQTPAAYLPDMSAQAQVGAEGSGGLPGGPGVWVLGGLAVLTAVAILATAPAKKTPKAMASNPRRRKSKRSRRRRR
jgi:hypothetical protein